jgi:PleD family two-component response regulator
MAAIRLASLRDRLVALVLVAALPTAGLAVYGYVTQRHEAAREGREETLKVAPMGMAAFPEHGNSGGALLRAADVALYRAKREGRDQVVLAD